MSIITTTTAHPLETTLRALAATLTDPRWTLSTPNGDHVLYRGAVVRFDSHGTGEGVTRIGKCRRCSQPRKPHAVRGDRAVNYNGFLCLPCPTCNTLVEVTAIQGTYNETKVCNGKCMGATGPACDCSCGGENHGSHWG